MQCSNCSWRTLCSNVSYLILRQQKAPHFVPRFLPPWRLRGSTTKMLSVCLSMSVITPLSQPYRPRIVWSLWTQLQRMQCHVSMCMLQIMCSISWWSCICLQNGRPDIIWALGDLLRLHHDHIAHVCTTYLHVWLWQISVEHYVCNMKPKDRAHVYRGTSGVQGLHCVACLAQQFERNHAVYLSLQDIVQRSTWTRMKNAYSYRHM